MLENFKGACPLDNGFFENSRGECLPCDSKCKTC